MADDMVTRYLQSRGAAPSAENASRVRQHYASNPDLLDRRAMGLPGGLDDNSSVLDALLDKHVAESMPDPVIPQGSVEVGQPEKIPPPSRTGASVKGPGEVGGTKAGVASRQGNYGPGAESALTGMVDESGMPVAGGPEPGNIGKFLLSLLGAGSVAGGAAMRSGRGAVPQAMPTNSPLPGTVPPTAAAAAPVDATDPATMRARMEAEVAAENDAMQRQMEQEALQRKRQQGTQETLDAAAKQRREFGQAARRFGGRR